MEMRFCKRCYSLVSYEQVSTGYFCVCPKHDEDLFIFETYAESEGN